MVRKIPQKIRSSVRYTALTALESVFSGGAYSNLMLNDLIKKADLSTRDSGLLTELVYGTISRKLTLDFYLQPFIHRTKKVDNWVLYLLELSAFQLTFLDRVPAHAVLNEAVEIAKAKGNQGIAGFVNGVLRSFQKSERPSLDTIQDPLERLSIRISLPHWLAAKLVEQIGWEETEKLGDSLFIPSKSSARVDLRRITREKALRLLREEGLTAESSKISPYGIVCSKGHLAGSKLFKEGLLTIQDESSMLVAPAMRLEEHHQVLDACAAPGGKTTHIATFLEAAAGGKITALDIHDHKLKLVQENADRLQVADVIETKNLDARKVQETFPEESFDRILVDAPCSGLGLMRRKPDIKYTKKPEDFMNLSNIQLKILESVAPTLKKSGILTYSTCTITDEENRQVIEAFLQEHPEFERISPDVNEYFGAGLVDRCVVLYPQQFMTDGFFICCMRKKG